MMNIACNLRKEWRKKIGRRRWRRRRAWLASWNGDYKIHGERASVCSAGPCLFVRQKDKQLSRELANKTGFAPAAHTRFFPCARRQKSSKAFLFSSGPALTALCFMIRIIRIFHQQHAAKKTVAAAFSAPKKIHARGCSGSGGPFCCGDGQLFNKVGQACIKREISF